MSVTIEQRERAEKKRSAVEASTTQYSRFSHNLKPTARYLDPPRDTAFPLEYAFHLLGDVRDKIVLEYGCGDGTNTVVLAQRGAHVIALDLSFELLDVARQRLASSELSSRVHFVQGSAHTLPLPDESVDVVFGIAILHHLDLPLASEAVNRVLRKGGRGIFQEPVRNSKLLGRARKLIPLKDDDVSPFERPLTLPELIAFAHGCAFQGRAFQLPTSQLISRLMPFWKSWPSTLGPRFDAAVLKQLPALKYFASVNVIEVTKIDRE